MAAAKPWGPTRVFANALAAAARGARAGRGAGEGAAGPPHAPQLALAGLQHAALPMMQRGEATSLGQVCTRAAPVRGPQPCGERSPPRRGGRAGVGGGEGRAADRGARMSASPTQALSDIMGALWLAVPKKRVSRARRAMRKSVPTLPASHRPLLCARAAVATLLPLA